MKPISARKAFRLTAGVAVTLVVSTALMAQTIHTVNPPKNRQPVPYDWSHHHLVYSAPANLEKSWKVAVQERYWQQWLRRNGPGLKLTPAALRELAELERERKEERDRDKDKKGGKGDKGGTDADSPLHRDWGASFSSVTGTATVGTEMYPAKFSFDVTAAPDCTNDFVVFNTGLAGSGTTPTVVAFNKLYSSQAGETPAGYCGTTGPAVMWSYNTGNAAATSVVLSGLGDKIAFVDTGVGGAVLRLLQWNAGDGGTIGSPATPTHEFTNTNAGNGGNTAWDTCPANQSCMISIALNGSSPTDSNSAPFYDYDDDTLYVGDDAGNLHKFTGVFLGTPGEVTTNWPINVSSVAISSPIYDSTSQNVFVGDANAVLYYVLEAGSTTGSCALLGSAPCLGTPSQALGTPGDPGNGVIVDSPLVDGTAGRVYAFDGQSTRTDRGDVFQFDTQLSIGSEVIVNIGTSSGTTDVISNIHLGTFDNTYYNSAGGTGYLYVCGRASSGFDTPALHQITITNGIMVPNGGGSSGPSNGFITLANTSSNFEECSPVSEVYNTAAGTDWLFFSVGQNATASGATGCTVATQGCIMSLNLTTGCTGSSACTSSNWPPTAVSAGVATPGGPSYNGTASSPGTAGTSGIVVDNVADTTAFPQSSSIYFMWIGPASGSVPCDSQTAGGCAVKLTQSGLN